MTPSSPSISIVVCSRSAEALAATRQNVAETIGVGHQFIAVDNRDGHHTIFSAYNEGARQAVADLVCIMHEDLCMHTPGWGLRVVAHFAHPHLGVLGVAGSHVVMRDIDWRRPHFQTGRYRQGIATLEQPPRRASRQEHKLCQGAGPYEGDERLRQVATVDGFWLCMRRSAFSTLHFDEQTYHGFHLYDTDICTQATLAGLDVAVCDDIDIEHQSIGLCTHEFGEALAAYNAKYRQALPIVRGISPSAKAMAKIQASDYPKDIAAHMAKDERRRAIMQKLADGRQDFTPEEQKEIKKSVYRYMRYLLRSDRSREEIGRAVDEYCRQPGNLHKTWIRLKFAYRRLAGTYNH